MTNYKPSIDEMHEEALVMDRKWDQLRDELGDAYDLLSKIRLSTRSWQRTTEQEVLTSKIYRINESLDAIAGPLVP